jgi:hypothetical protein
VAVRPEERDAAVRRLAEVARAAGLGGNSTMYEGRRTTSFIGNVGIGLGLLVSVGGGALLLYGLVRQLVTTGTVRGAGALVVPLVAGVLTALGLRWRRRRTRRWLDLREHGLVYHAEEAEPVAARWEDIAEVDFVPWSYQSGVTTIRTVTAARVLGVGVGDLSIGMDFGDGARLGRIIADRVVPFLLADLTAAIRDGETLEHLTWCADAAGLSGDGWSAPWGSIVEVRLDTTRVQITLADGSTRRLKLSDPAPSATTRAFVQLVDRMRRPAARPSL